LNRAAKQTSLDSFAKKKRSSKFKTEWLSEVVETELPTSAGNRMTKVGGIFVIRDSTACKGALVVGDFSTGKRWDDWKMICQVHVWSSQKNRRQKL